MQVVENRSAETLLPVINRACKQSSIIYSDEQAAYRRITETIGFDHATANHSLNFVDSEMGVHTQNIELY